jgi:hypothetical protein
MSSKITLFDFNGNYLAELDKVPVVRSWVRDDFGRAQFTLSIKAPQCTERNLRYGNLVLVEHIPSVDAAGVVHGQLPPWVGVILPPRIWTLGQVQVTAYTPEYLLQYRGMPQGTIKGTPGNLFSQLIQDAVAVSGFYLGGTSILPGAIDTSGPTVSEVVTSSAYDHIKSIATKSGNDWNITGVKDVNNHLSLYANWYLTVKAMTNLLLADSNSRIDASTAILTENGPIYNAVYGQSQTQSLSPVSSQQDLVSMGLYGILHVIQTFPATDQNSVDTASKQFIIANSQPRYVTTPTALDVAQTFTSLFVGALVQYSTLAAGFQGGAIGFTAQYSITSMQYDDATNECALVLGSV